MNTCKNCGKNYREGSATLCRACIGKRARAQTKLAVDFKAGRITLQQYEAGRAQWR